MISSPRRKQERAQRILQTSFRFFIRMMTVLGVIALDVDDEGRLRALKGQLVIANHPTLIDVVILIALIPQAQCIIKYQLWSNPFLRHIVKTMRYIRNDLPPDQFMDACRAVLAEGNNLIIFPEGTRSPAGSLHRFYRGFANIALLLQKDILPITISCSPLMLTKGTAWYRIPPRPGHFIVTAAPTLDIAPFMLYRSRGVGARALVAHCQGFFDERLRHARPGT